MQIGRTSCFILPFVELGVAFSDTSHLSTWLVGWLFPLGQEGKDNTGDVSFFHCGSFLGFYLLQEHGVGIVWWDQVCQVDWLAHPFGLISVDSWEGLLMNCCFCWLWQTPGRNENVKKKVFDRPRGKDMSPARFLPADKRAPDFPRYA